MPSQASNVITTTIAVNCSQILPGVGRFTVRTHWNACKGKYVN